MKFTITIDGDTTDSQSVSVLALLAGINNNTIPNVSVFTATGTDEPDEPAVAVAGDPNERDSAGLPWHDQIHSKARSKNADGTWRKRKGVQSDLVTAVEAQLRAANNAPAPAVAPVAPPATPPAAPAPTVPPAAPVVAAPAPVPEVSATPPTPPVAPGPVVGAAVTDFTTLMEAISKGMAANLIDNTGEFLKWMCAQPDLAVSQITEIAANPAKIAAAYNHLVAQNRIAP